MQCETCGSAAPDDAASCPFCQAPAWAGGVGRAADPEAWLTRAVDDGIARTAAESLLTRHESLGELIRDDALAGPLAASELRAAAQHALDDADQRELDAVDRLVPAELVRMDLDGLKLGGLIDRSGGDLAALKTGLVFLRARRYDEAAEYWALKRQTLPPESERLELLLLLMELFTYLLAGRAADAARLRSAVREHPLFERYRRGDRA